MTTIVVEENVTELGITTADTALTVVEQVSSLNIVEQTTSVNIDTAAILVEIVNPDTIGPPGPPGSGGSGTANNYFPGGWV